MRLAGLLALLLLAACEDRRSFDERYRDTAAEIEARERALAANMADNQQGTVP